MQFPVGFMPRTATTWPGKSLPHGVISVSHILHAVGRIERVPYLLNDVKALTVTQPSVRLLPAYLHETHHTSSWKMQGMCVLCLLRWPLCKCFAQALSVTAGRLQTREPQQCLKGRVAWGMAALEQLCSINPFHQMHHQAVAGGQRSHECCLAFRTCTRGASTGRGVYAGPQIQQYCPPAERCCH